METSTMSFTSWLRGTQSRPEAGRPQQTDQQLQCRSPRARRPWLAVAALALLLGSVGQAKAGMITVTFPSSDSTTFDAFNGSYGTLGSGGGGVFFVAGSAIEKTFTATGLPTVTSSHWVFDMSDVTASGVDNTFDVLINGTKVGSYDFIGLGVKGGTHHFDLTFGPSAPITGDTYTLEILATSTVPPGEGSWNWYAGGEVTLSDVTAAPEPSTLVLLGTATVSLGGFFGWRRRKQAAT
jgi:hypothetical protein